LIDTADFTQTNSKEFAYEGNPFDLKICYASLKNMISRPVVAYNQTGKEQPHY